MLMSAARSQYKKLGCQPANGPAPAQASSVAQLHGLAPLQMSHAPNIHDPPGNATQLDSDTHRNAKSTEHAGSQEECTGFQAPPTPAHSAVVMHQEISAQVLRSDRTNSSVHSNKMVDCVQVHGSAPVSAVADADAARKLARGEPPVPGSLATAGRRACGECASRAGAVTAVEAAASCVALEVAHSIAFTGREAVGLTPGRITSLSV